MEEVLDLYPLVNAADHRISRGLKNPQMEEAQNLLSEAVAEQHESNRKHLREMLKADGNFVEDKNGFRLNLDAREVDWLLEVLNDVRIGCWIAIGSPNYGENPKVKLTTETAKYFWAMDLTGFFQSCLLDAVDGTS